MAKANRGSPGGSVGRSAAPSRTAPVLATTRYDLVSSLFIALVFTLVLVLVWVIALWLANRPIRSEPEVAVEMVQLGGFEDGAIDETLKVESPADPTDDPSVAEVLDDPQVQDVVENVMELSENAARQTPEQTELSVEDSGKEGSAEGSGRRPLGSGGGDGNVGDRWFIRFGDQGTIEEYARQLDDKHIHLGLLVNGRIERLSNFSGNVQRTTYRSGKELKDQSFFTWQGGARKKADIKLLKEKGNLPADRPGTTIFHFYRPQEIGLLVSKEKKVLEKDKRSVKDIARTYFSVVRKEGGYDFVVTRIVYK